MTNAESQYFTLMRAALWGQLVEFDAPPDWSGVMNIARHHATDVLVADVASRLTGDAAPSGTLLREMQTTMRNNLVNLLELKRILTMALTALRKENVEAVLLKGFGLAMLYPNPNLRQFGDIDLFVGTDDFHKACEVLRGLPGGYNWGEETEVGRHYNIEFGRHPMEVHRLSADVTDPKESEIYADIEHNGLLGHPRQVDLEGFPISVPSREFMVFFTFFHAWHHFLTSGVGWRQLGDVAMTLHSYMGSSESPAFNIDQLRQWLDSMHLIKPWQTFGWLMVTYLGLPETELPFYDASCHRKAQKLYKRIMAEGNFRRPNRYKRRKPQGRLAKKIHSFFGIFVDFFQLASVFPSHAFRQMRAALKVAFLKFFQKN